MSCCDLGMTRRYSEENFPTLLANNGQGINLTFVVTWQYKGCLACFPPGLVLLEQLSKRVCFVGDFLQIKLCHPRLVCATKTSLDSSSCNLTKVSGTADSSAELNHSLENLQFVCQSKVRHLILGSIYKNVLLLFLAWSPFKEKKKGNELHVPWSSQAC